MVDLHKAIGGSNGVLRGTDDDSVPEDVDRDVLAYLIGVPRRRDEVPLGERDDGVGSGWGLEDGAARGSYPESEDRGRGEDGAG